MEETTAHRHKTPSSRLPKKATHVRPTRLPRYVRMWIGFLYGLERAREEQGRAIKLAFITPEEAERRGLLEEPTAD